MSAQTWIVVADGTTCASVAAAGRSTGQPVKALVFGGEDLSRKVARYGVESVLWFDGETMAEAYASQVADLAAQELPAVMLCADEPIARTIVGIAAARIGAATVSSIVKVTTGDVATVDHLVAGSASVETIEFAGPVAGSLADGGEEAEPGDSGTVEAFSAQASGAMSVVATHADSGAAASLAAAEKVVGCGLGVGAKENLQLVFDLADALGAEVACSLPLCDNFHWFEHSSVVGTSTQKISPRFYLACGVSGVPQHVLGVKGAKTICAINNDPDAPIFKESAYGILGDMKEVVPALTQAIKSL